jgi:hypothetical protein
MSFGQYFLIYIVGYFSTFFFLVKFGKRIGIDYDVEKTYVNHDDWNSNASAYTAFSLMWPIFMTVLSIVGFFALLVGFADLIILHANKGSKSE